MSYYQTLGINKNATPDEIKKAYRKLANQHHPDKGGDVSKFQEIQTAYDTLSDPQKKMKYDMGGNGEGIHININDPFSFFNFGGAFHRRAPIFTVTLVVSLEQVANGSTETIRINTPSGPQLAEIQIPLGVEDGVQYRYQNIISDGDLNVVFMVRPHPKFNRQGYDLISDLEVDFLRLVTGVTLPVTDIYGSTLQVAIPPMTKPGTRMRLAGHGLKHSAGKGDQYVLIQGKMPDRISDLLKETISNEIKEQN